ncbi:MAG: AEC family transporter [Peptoniphilaceae bacterium]
MEYLSLGVKVIFPVFFVLFIGFFLKTIKVIDDNFISKSTNLVFYVALPIKLFFSIRDSELDSLDLNFVLYIIVSTLVLVFTIWFFASLFIKDKRKLSAFIHCAYRSNFVYIGLPILSFIMPSAGMDAAIVVMTFGLTIYNLLSIILLTYYGSGKFKIKDFIFKIIKNPMLIGIAIGIFAKIIDFRFFESLEKGLYMISDLSTPLSLILVGGSLKFTGILNDKRLVFMSSFIKVVLAAAILVPIGYKLGLANDQLVVAYIFFGSPCAVNCFIMGKKMGSDAELTSKIVTMSFAMSIITYAIGIAVLKTFSII